MKRYWLFMPTKTSYNDIPEMKSSEQMGRTLMIPIINQKLNAPMRFLGYHISSHSIEEIASTFDYILVLA
jgi:hypothetical protein